MRKSHKHTCKKCKKDYYYLQDNELVIHTCNCHHDWVELENDNGAKIRLCKKCENWEQI